MSSSSIFSQPTKDFLNVENNILEELIADKMPVGLGATNNKFNLHTIPLFPGDTIYVYTDGYADQFGGPLGKKFKYKQLNDLLAASHQLPCSEQETILNETFNSWRDKLEQVDDVCIIGIKV